LSEKKEQRALKENEYIDKDGLIHCSVCKKPKQIKNALGIFKALCECEKKRAEEENRRLEQTEREQKQKALIKRCFSGNTVLCSKTFDGVNLENASAKLCFNYCKNWEQVKENSLSLILCGNVGSGKTYLSCCICNKIINDYCASVRFITEYDFLNGYMNSDNKDEYIASCSSCALLVLDDFGTKCFNKGKSNGYATYMNDLIDARYKKDKPMVIKNHSSIEEQRMFSRLFEMSGGAVQINSADMRKSIGAKKKEMLEAFI